MLNLISKAKELVTFVPFLSQGLYTIEAENTVIFLSGVTTANVC